MKHFHSDLDPNWFELEYLAPCKPEFGFACMQVQLLFFFSCHSVVIMSPGGSAGTAFIQTRSEFLLCARSAVDDASHLKSGAWCGVIPV